MSGTAAITGGVIFILPCASDFAAATLYIQMSHIQREYLIKIGRKLEAWTESVGDLPYIQYNS